MKICGEGRYRAGLLNLNIRWRWLIFALEKSRWYLLDRQVGDAQGWCACCEVEKYVMSLPRTCQWVPGTLSVEVNCLGHAADHCDHSHLVLRLKMHGNTSLLPSQPICPQNIVLIQLQGQLLASLYPPLHV
jgi:hypothetical protein